MLYDDENEMLEVFDELNRPANYTASKSQVHSLGLIHRTAHIWILNNRGELLLQRRSRRKKDFPRYLDISAAGHIRAGESVIEGGLRELYEELGIVAGADQLIYLGTIRYFSRLNKEFAYIYLLRGDYEEKDFSFFDEEVEEVRFVHWKLVEERIEMKQKDLLVHGQEEAILFDYIRSL